MPNTFTHASTTHLHLTLHTTSLVLTFPAPFLFFLSLYALLVASITSPFTLLWPYILSSISTGYVLSLERRALGTRTLSRRWYGRLQGYRLGAMLVVYLPFVVAAIFSRGLRMMIAEVIGYSNLFWEIIGWLNVVHWLLAIFSAAYTPFYHPSRHPTSPLPSHNGDIPLPTDSHYTDERSENDLSPEDDSDMPLPAPLQPHSGRAEDQSANGPTLRISSIL
ncbi:hypothetical protein BU16DRAFT_567074 [Lophium mytilinum]|uniref:Uncharacterized protein n=1 Tax=Lophium mytilinum TaxID=390894 RepID=A0A6A6QD14_9PEZI|nr:hypothetical protein BU16DRAFT_567074 [Lophium mytilinum]